MGIFKGKRRTNRANYFDKRSRHCCNQQGKMGVFKGKRQTNRANYFDKRSRHCCIKRKNKGGTDQKGNPLIVFPTDCADLIDVYSFGDILKLLTVYTDIAGGKVAIVADLKHGWTEECIRKLTLLLDEMQVIRKSCIVMGYYVKPCVKTKKRILHRQLSRVYGSGRMLPFYQVERVETFDQLYTYIDKSQLTPDYGGTLQYNHAAWVDFQKTYRCVIEDAENILKVISDIQQGIDNLNEGINKDSVDEVKDKEIKAKIEALLGGYQVREVILKCKECIERLETPETDESLLQIHSTLLVHTSRTLRQLLHDITEHVRYMESSSMTIDKGILVDGISKLEECQRNAKQLTETIECMKGHVIGLPHIGCDLTEAQSHRQDFISSVIDPSKEIVQCATAILLELDQGKHTNAHCYAMTFDIAKQLTYTLQPFTRVLNELNECYTRIHLFYVVFTKTRHWKEKATHYIIKYLLPIVQNRPRNKTTCLKTKSKSIKQNKIRFATDTQCLSETDDECLTESNIKKETEHTTTHVAWQNLESHIREPITPGVIYPPSNWENILQHFYHKHPAPKKKHLRLITKFAPQSTAKATRTEAEIIAERTMFILTFMKKDVFKSEDILHIVQWRGTTPEQDTNII